MPKSSTESADAELVAARSGRASAITLSSIAAVSVISSVSACAGRPWRRSACSTRPGRSRLGEVGGGEVDADADLVAVGPPARRRRRARGRARSRSAGAISSRRSTAGRNSSGGTNWPVAVPAQQRLGALDGAGARVDQRLVVQVELVVASAARTSSTSSRSRAAARRWRSAPASASAAAVARRSSSASAASTTEVAGTATHSLATSSDRARRSRRRARRRGCGRCRGSGRRMPRLRQPGGGGDEPGPERVERVGAHHGLPGAVGGLQRPQDVAGDERDGAEREQPPGEPARRPATAAPMIATVSSTQSTDRVGEVDDLRCAGSAGRWVGGDRRQHERGDDRGGAEQDEQRVERERAPARGAATGGRSGEARPACTGTTSARARRRGRGDVGVMP